jgi:general stress protein YciG
MASQHSGSNPQKDDKSRQRQHGTQQDQDADDQDGGSSGGKENPGSSANDPDPARESGQKGGKS